MRWFRVGLTLSFIVLMAWFTYQFFVQKSFFDWLGDRIDNLTDEGAPLWRASIASADGDDLVLGRHVLGGEPRLQLSIVVGDTLVGRSRCGRSTP